MHTNKEHLTILSEAEQSALYDLPEYDDEQRLEYLNLTDDELQLLEERTDFPGSAARLLG